MCTLLLFYLLLFQKSKLHYFIKKLCKCDEVNDFRAADTYVNMVFVGSNGGSNGSPVEVASCSYIELGLNGGRTGVA